MADLWDYDEDDLSDQLSDTDEEEQPSTKKRKPPVDGLDLEGFLPSDKRAKLKRKYGNLHGRLAEVTEDDGSKKKEDAKDADYDSDLEILEGARAAEEAKARQKMLEMRQKELSQRAKMTGNVPTQDWQNRQLLARVKARMQQPNPEDDDVEEEEEEEIIDDSPAPPPPRRAHHQPAPSPVESLPSPPPTAEEKRLLVNVKDKNGNELKVRYKWRLPFSRLFEEFKRMALEKDWIPSAETQCKFIFDGEVVGPDATPESLDMEDEDIIEVRYQ